MHVRRANYRAIWRRTVFSLGALFLAHMVMAGSASLNHPVSPSSDEIQWMTRPAAPQALSFVGHDHMRLHIGLLHTALRYGDAAKDILTGVKLVAAQTARIGHTSQHPSSLHRTTKGLMMMNTDLIIALCCTSSTRVLERVSSSFLYARSVHVLQHSTIHYFILSRSDDRPTASWNTV